jgi:pimeloyl-ACP methyl ester carboxylesterase
MRTNDQSLLAPDGTRIAFRAVGSGPTLLLTNGLTTTSTFWKYLIPSWLERYQVVTWDLPGHGDSAPAATPGGATIEALPPIMAGILERLGVAQAIHIGWSVGSQIVLELYRQYPAAAKALVMLFGPAGHALENTRLPIPGAWIERLARHRSAEACVRLLGRCARAPVPPGLTALLRRAHIIGPDTRAADLREILDHLARLDPRTIPLLTLSAQKHSAFDVLPKVKVPLLLMTARQDPFMPMEHVAMPMHQAAPGSELVVLDAATHAALLDFPGEVARHIDDFIARRVRASAPS